jgi:hypothetical protein
MPPGAGVTIGTMATSIQITRDATHKLPLNFGCGQVSKAWLPQAKSRSAICRASLVHMLSCEFSSHERVE